jgi:hypothetical protein
MRSNPWKPHFPLPLMGVGSRLMGDSAPVASFPLPLDGGGRGGGERQRSRAAQLLPPSQHSPSGEKETARVTHLSRLLEGVIRIPYAQRDPSPT